MTIAIWYSCISIIMYNYIEKEYPKEEGKVIWSLMWPFLFIVVVPVKWIYGFDFKKELKLVPSILLITLLLLICL